MKRTPLKRHTPLKAKKRGLHWITPRKIAQLNSEVEARKALCYRAGGIPILAIKTVRIKGVAYELTTVTCQGGGCECGQPECRKFGQLEPHEKKTRGSGGKVSLANSLMVLRACHERLQGKPMWTKRNGGNE